MVLGLLAGWGCGGKQDPGVFALGDQTYVQELRLEGVRSFDAADVLQLLVNRPQGWNPIESRRTFQAASLEADAARIRTFYRERGHFDVQVTYDEPRYVEERARVFLRFHVVEGPRYWVHPGSQLYFAVEGLSASQADAVNRGLKLRADQPFDLAVWESARQEVRRRLQEQGFARARVDMRVYVFPAEGQEGYEEMRAAAGDRPVAPGTAQVFYFVEPGEACVFGEMQVRGSRHVPEAEVLKRLPMRTAPRSGAQEEGKDVRPFLYRHSFLELAQRRLYETGAFSSVIVRTDADQEDTRRSWGGRPSGELVHDPLGPALGRFHGTASSSAGRLVWDVESIPATGYPEVVAQAGEGGASFGRMRVRSPRVNVEIEVGEYPAQTYRSGLGVGLESGRMELYGRGEARWRHVLAPLNRIELDSRVGYAVIPSVLQAQAEGFVGRGRLAYIRPGFLGTQMDLTLSIRHEEGLEEAYRFGSPQARVGITRRIGRHFSADVGYNIDVFFIRQDALAATDSQGNLPGQFMLGYLDTTLRYDRRDAPLQAMRGFYLELYSELGQNVLFGDYLYARIQPDVRVFLPLTRRMTLATRASYGHVFSADPPVLRTQRLYGGGGDSFRGLPRRRLSTYEYVRGDGSTTGDALCLLDLGSRRCSPVPVGAFSMALATVELRMALASRTLFLAVFTDAGNVAGRGQAMRWSLDGDGLQLASGAGLRLATPIGPARFDVGYRYTDGLAYSDLRSRFGFFFSIGEAF